MAAPSCPPNYECDFVPKAPPHYWEHWWDGPWGIVVGIAALVALCVIVSVLAYYVHALIVDRRNRVARHEQRAHALAMAEQLTMQMDAAKGDPALLKLVREQDDLVRRALR